MHPAESETSLAQHWQRRRSYLEARDATRAAEQSQEIERIQRVLALENLFTVGTALVREGESLLDSGNASDALARCTLATRVAPRLVVAHLCAARAQLKADLTAIGPVVGFLGQAVSATLSDVRTRRVAVADGLFTLFAALALASGALILLVVLRYGNLFLHDLHHVFPRGTARWQSTMLALVLLALPAVLGFGALTVLALGAFGVSLLLTRGEAIAVGTAALLLLAAQLGMSFAMKSGVVGQVANDVYLLERGDAPAPSAARLQSLLDSGNADYTIAFAVGRYHKRFGRYTEAKAAYEEALRIQETPEVLNNLGTVQFLLGDSPGAQKLYRQATSKGFLASPHYNLAKLHFREGRLEQGQEAQRQSIAIDGERVRTQGFQDDPRANLYLMDETLSDAHIEALARQESQKVSWLAAGGWTPLTGRLPVQVLFALPLLVAAFVSLGQVAQRKLRASSRCEKCGRPVCPRCDPEIGPTTGICGQCITVFVRRTGVDPPDRIRKEIEVRRYRRRNRITVRVLGVLLAGAGHVFSGRLVWGAVFLTVFSLFGTLSFLSGALLRPPMAVDASVSPLFLGVLGLLLVATWGVSLHHLVKHEEGD